MNALEMKFLKEFGNFVVISIVSGKMDFIEIGADKIKSIDKAVEDKLRVTFEVNIILPFFVDICVNNLLEHLARYL